MARSSTTPEVGNNSGHQQDGETTQPVQRVPTLALHGSEGTGARFRETLQQWNHLVVSGGDENNGRLIELQVTAVDAPVAKGQGWAWWSMPPGVRSFTAEEYEGFETSADMVLDQLSPPARQQDSCRSSFDLVVAHSQGAILTTALLALDRIPKHPSLGYILNGVAWPNPFTAQLESLRHQPDNNDDGTAAATPRVLLIIGERDAINPPAQAQRVQDALGRAGFDVSVVTHPGGHSVPIPMRSPETTTTTTTDESLSTRKRRDDETNNSTIAKILEWISQGQKDGGSS